jgi:hypothetical protein
MLVCVRDKSGNPFLRHEKKIATDSPTEPRNALGMRNLMARARPKKIIGKNSKRGRNALQNLYKAGLAMQNSCVL